MMVKAFARRVKEYEEIVSLVAEHTAKIVEKIADEYECGLRESVPCHVAMRIVAQSIRKITAEHFAQAVKH